MTYEEFRSEILRKLEEKKNDLGYEQVKYYPDGFTSEEPGELSTIRNTNVKYHKMESDVLSGDFIILLVESQHHQVCRFSVSDLYEEFTKGSWEAVWTIINSNLAGSRKYAKLGIMELMEENKYEALREKLFIRPLNYNDHRYELKRMYPAGLETWRWCSMCWQMTSETESGMMSYVHENAAPDDGEVGTA